MRLCRIAGISVRCEIPAFCLFLLCIAAGLLENAVLLLITLTIHEISHTFLALRLGYTVSDIAVQPFGFVASFIEKIDEWDALSVAAAGPLCSLIAGTVCFAVSAWTDTESALLSFGRLNLTIGLINLLPVLPLDGGRILRAVLFRFSRDPYRLSAWVGVTLAVVFLFIGALVFIEGNITMLLMGAFLLPAALAEAKRATEGKSRELLARSRKIRKGEALRVKYIAVQENTSLADAFRQTAGSCYTLLHVIDENMLSRGTVDEGELLRLIATHGTKEPIGAFVDRNRRT